MYIRQATKDDSKQLCDLHSKSFGVDAFDLGYTDELFDNIFVGIIDNNIITSYTVIIENKLIHSYGKVAHLEDFAIHKDYRGKGYGKQMIDFVMEFCKEQGCYKAVHSCPHELVEYYKKNAGMKEWQVSMRRDFN